MIDFRRIPFVLLLLPLVAAILIWHYCVTLQQTPSDNTTQYSFDAPQPIYQAVITTYPQVKGKTVRTQACLVWYNDTLGVHSIEKNVILYFTKDSLSLTLTQGDSLLIKGHLSHSNRGNPYEYDYDQWLAEHGLSGIMFVNSDAWTKNGHTTLYNYKAVAERCRFWFINKLHDCGLDEDELGIAAAMVVGERNVLSYETRFPYSAAGVSHVLAVSGLHTGIVFGAIMLLLTGFGAAPLLYKQRRRRWIVSIIGISFIWFYVLLTGLSPSVTRAALMISILYIGSATGRLQSSANTLAAAAFINLLIEPKALFSVSFQLSYAAVIGILLFYKYIVNLLKVKNFIGRAIWELTSISIAAQLGTLPLTLWYFEQTSNYFVLANIFVIPLATLIIYSAAIFAIFAATPLGVYLSYPVKYLITAMNWIVKHIETIPLSTSNISITPAILIALIITIGIIAVYLRKHHFGWLIGVGCMMLVTVGFFALHLNSINLNNRIIIYNSYPYTVVTHQKGRTCTIFTDSTDAALSIVQPLIKHEMIREVQTHEFHSQTAAFTCDNKMFLYLAPTSEYTASFKDSIDVDILLLGGKGNINLENIFSLSSPKQVVLLSSFSQWRETDIEKHVIDLGNNSEDSNIHPIRLDKTRLSAILLQ